MFEMCLMPVRGFAAFRAVRLCLTDNAITIVRLRRVFIRIDAMPLHVSNGGVAAKRT
jgi:hypothetical protein